MREQIVERIDETFRRFGMILTLDHTKEEFDEWVNDGVKEIQALMPQDCEWSPTSDWEHEDLWQSGCGEEFMFIEGCNPETSGFKHCVYCGGKITPPEEC